MAGHSASPAARNKAVAKYIKTKLDRIEITYSKESNMKQLIAEHAAKGGESTAEFVKRAIKETLENDNKKTQ